jgi:hypothetical protein
MEGRSGAIARALVYKGIRVVHPDASEGQWMTTTRLDKK